MRGGARCATPTVVVHVGRLSPPPGQAPQSARAGFVVGRSVGGAVVRNRVTRRLRHLMAAELDDVAPGTGVVVRALPAAARASSAELASDLAAALRRCLGRGARTRRTVSP